MAQLRIGIPANTLDSAVALFPSGVEIVRLPDQPASPVDIDLWIAPYFGVQARATWAMLRGVKAVQSLTAGVDWLLHLIPADVTLCDARGVHDIPTSEWVVAAILAAVKRFPLYRDLQHAARWFGQQRPGEPAPVFGPNELPYRVLNGELAGKHILIVGYGSIGAAIESRLAPFGVFITRVARTARPDANPPVHAVTELNDLLPAADIVVLILPSTPETNHLIDAAAIARLKPGALLVNAARGPVVDTAALLAALLDEHIHAILDVTDPEPLPPDHPLWHAPNCFITPHIGGSTAEFYLRVFRFAARQVQHMLDGQPMENIVPRSQGY